MDDIDPATYELLTLRSAYDTLRDDYAGLQAKLQRSAEELGRLRASNAAEMQQAQQVQAVVSLAQRNLEEAVAEKSRELEAERERSAHTLQLRLAEKQAETEVRIFEM